MTDRSKASGPEATQSELTSEELEGVSGGMMANEPADVSGDGGSGGGATTTTTRATSATTIQKISAATESYANLMNQVRPIV